MSLTRLFELQIPKDQEGTGKLLERADALAEQLITVKGDDLAVLRILNEYATISNLNEYFHSELLNRRVHAGLQYMGYKENANTGKNFNADDPKNVSVYLIGQAMVNLKDGHSPGNTFITQSSLALNGIHSSRWSATIRQESQPLPP